MTRRGLRWPGAVTSETGTASPWGNQPARGARASTDGAGAVIVSDPVHSGAAPGTIHRLSPRELTPSAHLFHQSTHAISVPEAIELAEVMKRSPRRLIGVGIEGESFRAGVGLSQEVEAALPSAVDAVLREAMAMMGPSRV